MDRRQPLPTKHLRDVLIQKGVKPSFQRIYILQYIMNTSTHPSVDTIFNALYQEIPTLSRTTVYNTLNLFAQKGIVTALNISDTELHYDYLETPHAHFKCVMCQKIYDIPLESELLNVNDYHGHQINETQINFKGICKDCLKTNNN